MTTHIELLTTCADLTTFSSISRSRTPNADLCMFWTFSLSLHPILGSTMQSADAGQPANPTNQGWMKHRLALPGSIHIARHEMPKNQGISPSCICECANNTLTLHLSRLLLGPYQHYSL